jgi:ATP-dependent DNA helicase DinG
LKNIFDNKNAVDAETIKFLPQIKAWSQKTQNGDFAELSDIEENATIFQNISSTKENCLGSDCPDFKTCFVMKARREAMAADIVVINHHLFFADLSIRETGNAELLPAAEVVIFDEAHHLVAAGLQFFGNHLSTANLLELSRELLKIGNAFARGLKPWANICFELEETIRCTVDWGKKLLTPNMAYLRWEDCSKNPEFIDIFSELEKKLSNAVNYLEAVQAAALELSRLLERFKQVLNTVQAWRQPIPSNHARWITESKFHVRLHESPLEIRDVFQNQIKKRDKTWIFTSATLGDDINLSWFTSSTGLEISDQILRYSSPFNYADLARIYIPSNFPSVKDIDHPTAVAHLAYLFSQKLQGKTFILTTTLRAMQTIAQALTLELSKENSSIKVLLQGQIPKHQLLKEFLLNPEQSILIGSQSFWEGIDVQGKALQCVIIDKLPFPTPGDAFINAKIQKVQAQGGNSFNEIFVAEAAISLKQGAGRLIRSENDHGLLAICDSRLLTMNYGRRLLNALPPMTMINSEEKALDYLSTLNEK